MDKIDKILNLIKKKYWDDKNGKASQYAPKELQNDREIGLLTVKNNG